MHVITGSIHLLMSKLFSLITGLSHLLREGMRQGEHETTCLSIHVVLIMGLGKQSLFAPPLRQNSRSRLRHTYILA